MRWLYDPPVNFWLLAYLMVGWLGMWFVLALFGTGYVQTGMPTWYRRAMGAYLFPTNRLSAWLDTRNVPNWLRAAVGWLAWLNLLVNLALLAWPVERIWTLSWRLVQHWFS